MLFALGAVSSLIDSLQSLGLGATSSSGQGQTPANPFNVSTGPSGSATPGPAAGAAGYGQISPQTMSALIAAQSQSGIAGSASVSHQGALQGLFSQIDANGDGQITKSEFENALDAGGTNIAMADDVFNKLDTNGDGTVSLQEMKSALQGAGGHRGHHHVAASGQSGAGGGSGGDQLMAALEGATSTSVANSDGSTTTTVTYPDGSKVTMTTPAPSTSSSSATSSSASSSYNWIEQMIQRQAQTISAAASTNASLSVSA